MHKSVKRTDFFNEASVFKATFSFATGDKQGRSVLQSHDPRYHTITEKERERGGGGGGGGGGRREGGGVE